MKQVFGRLFTILLGFLVLSVSGCASTLYENTPRAYFQMGHGDLTMDTVQRQDKAMARCVAVAKETTPKDWKAAWEYGWRYGLGGFGGGSAGYWLDSRIANFVARGSDVLGAGAYYGAASGVVGAMAGPLYNSAYRRNTEDWCLALDAYGMEMHPPSEAERVRARAEATQASFPEREGGGIAVRPYAQAKQQDNNLPPTPPTVPQ